MRRATSAELQAGFPPLVALELSVRPDNNGKLKTFRDFGSVFAKPNAVHESVESEVTISVADEASNSSSSSKKRATSKQSRSHSADRTTDDAKLFHRRSTLGLGTKGKEQLSEGDRNILKELGVSEGEMAFFTSLFHNNKKKKDIRGMNLNEFGQSLRLDDFWTTKIFDKFTSGDRMELFEFVFVCTALRPCKTERSLRRKCELMACAIADVKSIDRSNLTAIVERDQVEKFVQDSAQGLRVRCGNNLVQTGVETLANLFDTDRSGTIEISEIRDWLLDNKHLIQSLGYDPKITRGLISTNKRSDIVKDMSLTMYLQELAFHCGIDVCNTIEWQKKLNAQGIFDTMTLSDVTFYAWTHLMGLPLVVYKKICQDLNLVFEGPQKISPAKTPIISVIRDMISLYWPWFVLAILMSFSIWLGVSSIDDSQRRVFGLEIYLARGSAGIILLFSVLIVFWVSYYTISQFARSFPFESFLFTHNQHVHMISGFTITAFALVHAVSWCVSYHRGSTSSQADWDSLSGTAEPMRHHWKSPPSETDFHFSLAGITGWVMTACLIIMAFTSRTSFRKKHFNTFFNLHHLYIVFFACIFLHGSQELMGKQKAYMLTAPFLIVFIFDKFYGICKRNRSHAASFNEEKSSQGTVRLDIDFHRADVKNSLGMWVWINVPEISRYEWHPFTVANADENLMVLQIYKAGDWTNRLHDMYNEDPKKLTRVYVDGPVGTIGKNFLAFKHMILIGAGVGVTPYACIIDYFHRQLLSGKELNVEHIHFIWLVRDQDCLDWYGELLESLMADWDGFKLDVYLTSRNKNHISALGYNLLATAMTAAESSGTISNNPTRLTIGRPDFNSIFHDVIERHANPEEHVGVFFCGNSRISATLEHLVETKSDPESCVFEYFPEFFT